MKQNKKGKICFVIYIAGFFFKFFFCYEVIVKKNFKERPANHYLCDVHLCTCARARHIDTERETESHANASPSLSLPNPHPFLLLLPDQGVEGRAQGRLRGRCSC